MKKVLSKFAEQVLSKEQMQKVTGGLTEITCTCSGGGGWQGLIHTSSDVNFLNSYYCGCSTCGSCVAPGW